MKFSILLLISFVLLFEEMDTTGTYPIWHKALKKWQQENGASGDSEEAINSEQRFNNLAENDERR